MIRLRSYLLHLISSAVFLSPASAQAQSSDRIQHRHGTESGKITAVTALKVTISQGGVSSSIPVEEIRSIRFGGEPSELNAARIAASKGRYQDALEGLRKISPKTIERTEIKQELDFLLASCTAGLALAGLEDLDQATSRVSKFLTQHRQSYHLPAAIELLGDLLLAADDHDAARTQYAKLGKAPAAYFQARSAMLIGRSHQQQDQHAKAIAEFDKARQVSQGGAVVESQRQEATLLAAISRSASGEGKQAADPVREIIAEADADDIELMARAYNALGSCYLNSGDERAARDAFLHVDLLFASVSAEHARALHELSQLWRALGQESRSQDARQRLQKDYPTSPWARR